MLEKDWKNIEKIMDVVELIAKIVGPSLREIEEGLNKIAKEVGNF